MPQKKQKGDSQKIIGQKIAEYLRERFGLTLADANSKQVGMAFSEFCVKDVFAPLHNFNDSDQIEDGLDCDESGDLGVDFVYCKENQYYILQMKYRSGGGNLSPDTVSHFLATDARIFDGQRDDANQGVQDLLADITPDSAIEYYLVTNCNVSRALKRKCELAQENSREEIGWHVVDGNELMKQRQDVQSDEDIPDKISVAVRAIAGAYGPNNPCLIELTDCLAQIGGRHKSIVTVVTGKEIKALYDPKLGGFGRDLFHANIRGHLGERNKVNVDLDKTLKNNPKDFYLFNNGVSALCDNMQINPNLDGSGVIICEKFQIINGAQTVSTIGQFGDNAKLEKVNVLLRITQPGADGDEQEGLRQRIIRSNNSQSAMRPSDFRSNDSIQKFIEHEFKRREIIYREPPHKKVVYQRRREKKKVSKNHLVVTMEPLAKALYAYSADGKNDKPSKLYSQPNFLFFERNMGGIYADLFWDGKGEIGAWPAQRTVKTIAIALLHIYLEKRLKEQLKPFQRGEQGGRNTVKFMSYSMRWQILWAFGTVVRKFHGGKEDEIYQRILKEDNCFVADGFVPKWFKVIEKGLQTILSMEQRSLQKDVGEGATLNFKTWMRDGDNVGKIKDMIDIAGKDAFPLS